MVPLMMVRPGYGSAPAETPFQRASQRRAGRGRGPARVSASRVALAYLAVAVVWVALSDQVVRAVSRDPSLLTLAQTLKGTAFVSGSALLIYLLVRRDREDREQTRRELARADAFYRTLVEQIPAITYVVAADGGSPTFCVSPRAEEILGYPARAWATDPRFWEEHLHPEDRRAALAWWSQAPARGGGGSEP